MGCYEEPKTFKGQTKFHIAVMMCGLAGIPESLVTFLSFGFISPHWRLGVAKFMARRDWL